ncbi:hypothetical protein L2E82_10733 [Cichorium intybus]|uniref:Uncharacterized protein n=1 Tax=Cichorium intybus TaxID=13427 RepID=A0ACB9GCC4_CICIN|nr:hypothetical protein L2E82_10733 [Cichorium intybus]
MQNYTYMSEAQRSVLNDIRDLDSAVADRIDEVLKLPLRREEERFKLLKLVYLDSTLVKLVQENQGYFRDFLFGKSNRMLRLKSLERDMDEMLKEKRSGGAVCF